MKIQEIPKLYSAMPMYHVDMPIKRLPDWIKEQQEELGLELNPDFQRGYVWTERQQERFVEFMLAGGKTGLELYFNHPGWMGDFEGDFVCVDGLQRITAIDRFLKNEIRVFNHLYKQFDGKIGSTMAIGININQLQSRHAVLNWYLEINFSGTVHGQDEYVRIKDMIEHEKDQSHDAGPSM